MLQSIQALALGSPMAATLGLVIALGSVAFLPMVWLRLRGNQRLMAQRLQAAALVQSEQQFLTLIRDLGVGVLLLNSRAEVLVSNQAARRFFHLPNTSVATEPIEFGPQLGHFQRQDGTPCPPEELPVQRAIAQKAPLDDAVIGLVDHATEAVRWLLVNVDLQLDQAGEVERVVGTFSDITIQKQAEAAVQAVANRETAISRIVQRMRQTLDLETIFAATTQELQQAVRCDRVWIYRFNPDWSGVVAAEALADPTAPSTLAMVDVNGVNAAIPENQRLIDRSDCGARKMQQGGFDDSYLVLQDTYLQETQAETYRRDRTYHCVTDIYSEGFDHCYLQFLEQWQVRAYVIVPIFSGSQLWGLLGIYNHHHPRPWTRHEVKLVLQVGVHLGTAVQQANLLSQTQQQAQALELAKQAADAANQAKGDFLASMSHELRTPLNAILGFTQILHRDPALADNHRELVGIVNRSGNHLLGLINNVLSLAKIEANKITLDEGCFDLSQLLQSVDDLLRLKAESRGLQLQLVGAADLPPTLWADHGKLRQILINLIGNAIKFTPQGSITVRWALANDHPERPLLSTDGGDDRPPKTHRLTLTVEDTGVGIAPEEIPHLFQPFEQTQSGRRVAEGSGLGLSLSHTFAQLMGGDIAVTSIPEQGSTFTLTLPVGLTTAAPPVREAEIKTYRLPAHLTYRILVADDVAESRLLLRYWLEEAGFEVREAHSGLAAIDVWQAWAPQLICLDMHMPELDGYAVARHIRQSTPENDPVILAVTASVFEEQQSDCLAAGCDAVLPKPLTRELLLECIGNHLGLADAVAAWPELSSSPGASPGALSPGDVGEAPPWLTPADVATLDSAWLAQVHRAAQTVDDRQIRQLIRQLPPVDQPLGQRLTQLLDEFRFDIIIELTTPSLVQPTP
ncbi:MAG: response regulator [Leptolyngbya sp. LCM1.Bin17]|nr:MAG: response regulator [Leptolyngbya sp. LCM1.Bin17]